VFSWDVIAFMKIKNTYKLVFKVGINIDHKENSSNHKYELINFWAPNLDLKSITKESINAYIDEYVFDQLALIGSKRWVVETLNSRNPNKKHKGNQPKNVKKIIHLVDNNKEITYAHHGQLEYLHSFSVRGHWRKCKSIGKDRCGEYKIINNTWVNPFIKGQGEYIHKVRVITQREKSDE
jgi:hypothetical protein